MAVLFGFGILFVSFTTLFALPIILHFHDVVGSILGINVAVTIMRGEYLF